MKAKDKLFFSQKYSTAESIFICSNELKFNSKIMKNFTQHKTLSKRKTQSQGTCHL